MRRGLTTTCRISLTILLLVLANLRATKSNADDRPRPAESDALVRSYLDESQRLYDEFTPLYRRLRDEDRRLRDEAKDGLKISGYERREKEYYQPLFAKSREAMRRIAGTDDYLAAWEKKVPQKIMAAMQIFAWDKEKVEELSATSIPYSGQIGEFWENPFGMQLFMLSTLAVVDERRDEILKDSVYENSEKGAKIRESARFSLSMRNPWTLGGMAPDDDRRREAEVRNSFQRIGVWYVFPPRSYQPTYDSSWYAMAIYSFKNERARKILFEIACSQDEQDRPFSDWAVYYLSLSPGAEEYLSRTQTLLKERIALFQKEEPALSKTLFNESGELADRSMEEYGKVLLDSYRNLKTKTYQSLIQIRRLLILERSLEFNEKIPENERKRFEIVRRELAISWALTRKRDVGSPRTTVRLKKGEEHFAIYAAEYAAPVAGTQDFCWEGQEEESLYRQERYRNELKSFYEKELTNPRFPYTDVQKRYIRNQLDRIREIEQASTRLCKSSN